jgi:hypothetical protein
VIAATNIPLEYKTRMKDCLLDELSNPQKAQMIYKRLDVGQKARLPSPAAGMYFLFAFDV